MCPSESRSKVSFVFFFFCFFCSTPVRVNQLKGKQSKLEAECLTSSVAGPQSIDSRCTTNKFQNASNDRIINLSDRKPVSDREIERLLAWFDTVWAKHEDLHERGRIKFKVNCQFPSRHQRNIKTTTWPRLQHTSSVGQQVKSIIMVSVQPVCLPRVLV